MIIRKIVTIVIAMCLLLAGDPVSTFAKEKSKTHKTHKQRKAERKKKKRWEKLRHWSNDFREKPGKHVGERMLKKQKPKEQKARRKHHLKPEGGTY